jgi:hypothetical protein
MLRAEALGGYLWTAIEVAASITGENGRGCVLLHEWCGDHLGSRPHGCQYPSQVSNCRLVDVFVMARKSTDGL